MPWFPFLLIAAAAGFFWRRPWRLPTEPSALLDRLLSGATFRDTIVVPVDAPDEDLYAALNRVTLADMPMARLLGVLRYLPGRLVGRTMPAPDDRPFLDVVLGEGGNIRLAEDPGREWVIGAVGRLHDPFDQQMVSLKGPEDFIAFDTPGYEKLAMSVRVETSPEGARSPRCLVLEHRTRALGRGARRRFGLYWLLIRPGGAFVTWQLLRAVRRLAEAPSFGRVNPS